ncbi:hypothetical protein ALC53_00047, partial [Atta colombica]
TFEHQENLEIIHEIKTILNTVIKTMRKNTRITKLQHQQKTPKCINCRESHLVNYRGCEIVSKKA